MSDYLRKLERERRLEKIRGKAGTARNGGGAQGEPDIPRELAQRVDAIRKALPLAAMLRGRRYADPGDLLADYLALEPEYSLEPWQPRYGATAAQRRKAETAARYLHGAAAAAGVPLHRLLEAAQVDVSNEGPKAARSIAVGKVKLSSARCGPRKGSLSAADRDRLPAAAFGIPAQRKYPLYVVIGNEGLPDREHAINAKARAAQQLDQGRLSMAALGAITKRADKVIALCDRIEGRG